MKIISEFGLLNNLEESDQEPVRNEIILGWRQMVTTLTVSCTFVDLIFFAQG